MKNIFAILVLVVIGSDISAQEGWRTGFRIGAGASKFFINNSRNVPYLTGGGVATYQLSRFVDINSELLVAFQGTKYDGVQEPDATLGFEREEPYRGDIRIVSLKVPVYPGFSFGSEQVKVKIHAGPSMNFNIRGFESRDYASEEVGDTEFEDLPRITLFTASMLYGAGFRFKVNDSKSVLIDFRYSSGLIDIYALEFNVLEPKEARINYFSISAGYLF